MNVAAKPLTRGVAHDPFHEWSRHIGVMKVDLDALAFSDRTGQTKVLVEIKRSKIEVEKWMPFDQDRPSYRILLNHAKQAGIPLWILYYWRGAEVLTDESEVKVFHLTKLEPYGGTMKILTLGEFAQRLRAVCGE